MKDVVYFNLLPVLFKVTRDGQEWNVSKYEGGRVELWRQVPEGILICGGSDDGTIQDIRKNNEYNKNREQFIKPQKGGAESQEQTKE